ncbi:DUF3987 domain-containing protein [Nitrobacter sp. NHB1]|uniref:DUF3987 domain-containing protein n=1 Tax=Nitrobacter sp. NHB1 TaxID=3119830 RepID=UPI002FFF9796
MTRRNNETVERAPTLDDFAGKRRWVAWREEQRKGSEKLTKVPYDPVNDRKGSSTDPSTWGTREQAEAAWRNHLDDGSRGGVGIVLGKLKDRSWLMGIDLDSCLDPKTGKIESCAAKVLDRFNTYAEVSPSGKGVKLFFLVAQEDADAVAALFERNDQGKWKARKAFVVDAHHEMAIDRERYYTVTGEWLEDWPETITTVSVETVRWFIEEAGPEFLEANGVTTSNAKLTGRDQSGSGVGFEFMGARKAAGDSYEEACTAILADRGRAGEWARRSDSRQLERAWGNNSAAAPLHTWDDPDLSLLDDRRGKLPSFPLETLQSEKLRKWAKRAAIGSGTTLEHVIVPFLGIASGLIGAARCARPIRSWVEPLTCWIALVGYSGSRKTPGMIVSRRALDIVESDQRDSNFDQEQQHKQKLAMAKQAQKHWEEDVKAAHKEGRKAPVLPSEATYDETFITPRLYVSDATVEALTLQLKARPQGMILFVEELARLFTNMSRHSQGSDQEFWLEAHDGLPWRQIRLGRCAPDIPHLLIGLIGGLQPDKLKLSFKGSADGMSARFLYAWPEEPPYRDLEDVIDLVDPQIVKVLKRLAYLDDFPEGDLKLTKQARDEFNGLRHEVSEKMNAVFGREREWWSKIPKHVLRLAGTLTLLWWAFEDKRGPKSSEIQSVDIENAASMVLNFFWPHACAALRQIGRDEQHADARKVLQWLIATGKERVRNEEVRRNPLGKCDAANTDKVMQFLRRAGWLRPYSEKTKGRSKKGWDVNPKLPTS